jgi:hypothetical protein
MAKSQVRDDDDERPASYKSAGTSRVVDLPSGGRLMFTLDVNLLQLEAEERSFLFQVIDLLEQFDKERAARATAAAQAAQAPPSA